MVWCGVLVGVRSGVWDVCIVCIVCIHRFQCEVCVCDIVLGYDVCSEV